MSEPLDAHAIALAYESADRKAIKAALLIEYRCSRGCLLLHVWQSPHGILYYIPPYKLSPKRTEQDTAPSARAKRTADGYRRWLGRGGNLDQLRGWGDEVGVALQCDHVRTVQPSTRALADADTATPGKPTRRSF